ncbi:3D domain-containing protein [Catalinimonas niigatensis]|uniref:3D domain-containing protein n=1 Tax=Catalinimonas niigatensis TaxID=1397264 RepID=UPI002665DD62|nr:hypothetical protein [Catalinimonas niigatensis]WPP49524.1 hypothetical protein PZB72_22900 [Catalinimonas niigatensis]
MKIFTRNHNFVIFIALIFLASCAETKTLEVTATAYNSVEAQTKKGDAATAAWGDQLEPGMKAIAVSRDLLQEEGFDYNTRVKIEGLPGTYRVLDKMNKRWEKRIDVYMGEDLAMAKEFGKQQVAITWEVE